jgi:hypothetical protein
MEEVPLRPVIDESKGRHAGVNGHDEEARRAGDSGPNAILLERRPALPLVGTPRTMP